MISTELATRILLTVIIVGAPAIDFCNATPDTVSIRTGGVRNNATTVKLKDQEELFEEVPLMSSSLDSPASSLPASTSPYNLDEERSGRALDEDATEDAETRLMPDSAESGILLPYEDDFPRPGGGLRNGARRLSGNQEFDGLPSSVSFQTRPLTLRISNGKALEQPSLVKDSRKNVDDPKKATFYIRNNCFGPRCAKQHQDPNAEKIPINSPEDWKNIYYGNNQVRSKKYDDATEKSNYVGVAATRYEDNVMESMSSNFHSQLAVPFMVVDNNSVKSSTQSSFAKRTGQERFSTSTPVSPEGWVKLKAISPDAYDPFKFSRNQSVRDSAVEQSTFNKRDSSAQTGNNFSKRVGVELNPESFADRWGWSANGDDNRGGGSRLPTWLQEQLKYGNRNSDQGKNWVKLEPIPVAGVSISKWVPKGTNSQDLPTTSWQTNRDRPNSNSGGQWWDRIDDNRILTGSRPSQFLRPNNDGNRFNDGGWGSNSKGSPLSSFDRYPTNSWNDIIYPDGPTSATVSWQQSKGISKYPSSFSVGSESSSGGGWGSDTRKPIVATGSWSAPPERNSRFPSFINRFSENRPSSYPVKQASEDDPRWVLISNSRRVTSAGGNRGDLIDRSKVLSYINRLHPDLDRRNDFPFYEAGPTSHRHGKDFWPFPIQGTTPPYPPNKDAAFHKLNATLSTLTPILLHRGGTTVRPPIVGTLRPSRPFASIFDEGVIGSNENSNTDLINSLSSTLSPLLSTYVGDGRATSGNAASLLQSSTNKPVRNFPGKIRQGLKNINPVYAAVGAGMIPATLAAVMPMVLGRRKRRDLTSLINRASVSYYRKLPNNFSYNFKCCRIPKYPSLQY